MASESLSLRPPYPLPEAYLQTLQTLSTLLKPAPSGEWATKYKVSLTTPSTRLLDFSTANSSPDHRVFIIPPQAGHHSRIADFTPGQSLVEVALEQRASVFAAEHLPATFERRKETIADTIEVTNKFVEKIAPGKDDQITLIGLCQGGWQSAIYASLYPEKVGHLVLAGSPIDFKAGFGKIQTIAELTPMFAYQMMVNLGGGNMPGELMVLGFKSLNAYDRFVKDPLDLYENISNPKFVERFERFQRWYENTQDLPGNWYLEVVEKLFKGNQLIKGELNIFGKKVDLSRINCPVTLIGGTDDDITLPIQVFNAEKYLGSADARKILIKAGHIGLFMGRTAIQEYWRHLLPHP